MRAKTRNQKYRRAEKIRRRESEREMKEAVNESRGQTRTLVLAIIAASVLALALIFWIVPAHAELEASMTKDRTLVLREVVSTRYYPKVPEGLWISDAAKLVTGEISEQKVSSFFGESHYSLDFPVVKRKTFFTDTMMRYQGGWVSQPLPTRVEKDTSQFSTWMLWILTALFMTLAIVRRVRYEPEYWRKKMIVSYLAIFVSMLAGILTGWGVDQLAPGAQMGWVLGTATGMSMSLSVFVATGWILTYDSSMGENGIETVIGLLVIVMNATMGYISGHGDGGTAMQCFFFLLVAAASSFLIAAFLELAFLAVGLTRAANDDE